MIIPVNIRRNSNEIQSRIRSGSPTYFYTALTLISCDHDLVWWYRKQATRACAVGADRLVLALSYFHVLIDDDEVSYTLQTKIQTKWWGKQMSSVSLLFFTYQSATDGVIIGQFQGSRQSRFDDQKNKLILPLLDTVNSTKSNYRSTRVESRGTVDLYWIMISSSQYRLSWIIA